jgi:hypothetical protein
MQSRTPGEINEQSLQVAEEPGGSFRPLLFVLRKPAFVFAVLLWRLAANSLRRRYVVIATLASTAAET